MRYQLIPADVYLRGHRVELPMWQGPKEAAKEKLKRMTEGTHRPSSAVPAIETFA
ncbi:MAG: hypothetical protein MN733_33950 [Nitrososphaera sp.]|nr:hypothetical protein [Nitrososphaera sp.]